MYIVFSGFSQRMFLKNSQNFMSSFPCLMPKKTQSKCKPSPMLSYILNNYPKMTTNKTIKFNFKKHCLSLRLCQEKTVFLGKKTIELFYQEVRKIIQKVFLGHFVQITVPNFYLLQINYVQIVVTGCCG